MIASMRATSALSCSLPTAGADMPLARSAACSPDAAAEDERVQQRVGAQPVAAVDGDAGDLAGRVEALDAGHLAVHVGLDAAHDVVLAGPDEDRLARDVDAREVLADVDDLAQRLERRASGHHGDVEGDAGAVGADAAALVDLGLPARETTSRDASSILLGAYFSMKRSPSEFRRCAPSPRAPSVMRKPFSTSVVGWYWIISMSMSGAPISYACAMPSPVQMRALVVGLKHWPAPPWARIVPLARKVSISPVRMLRATQPTQAPASSRMSEVVNHSS